MPFTKALDAVVECILESLKLQIGGHCFPTFDKKFEAWDDTPNGGCMLTREGLLDV